MSRLDFNALAAECQRRDGPTVIDAEAPSPGEVDRLVTELAAHGIEARVVDAAALSGKAPLLRALAAAFDFPSYFGHNWDAALDLLSDLSWLPSRGGWVCVLLHADRFRAAHPHVHDGLLETFRAAAERWRGHNADVVLKLVCCGSGAEA